MNTSILTPNVASTELINKIASFINNIGIECRQGSVPENTFLPGVEIVNGTLVYDETLLSYPGDLLHEAGHLAVLLPEYRKLASGSENLSGDIDEGAAEMGAIAWSWAAGRYIGLAPEVVFHAGGYKGGSENLVESLSNTNSIPIGVPILSWLAMTDMPQPGKPATEYTFPEMKCWLRYYTPPIE